MLTDKPACVKSDVGLVLLFMVVQIGGSKTSKFDSVSLEDFLGRIFAFSKGRESYVKCNCGRYKSQKFHECF